MQQSRRMAKGGSDPKGSLHWSWLLSRTYAARIPCWSKLAGRTCDLIGNPCWSMEGPMLEWKDPLCRREL